MKERIAVTTTSFAQYGTAPLCLLEERGLKIIRNTFGRKLERKEIIDLCNGCIGIVAGTELYDRDVLEALGGLKVISRCGVGMENIDINAINRIGIKVFNTPDAPTLAVAELTVGLILNLLRKVNQMDTRIRNGRWEKLMGNLLYAKKVGIIGFGRIGQKVGEILSAFGAEIAYCDIEPKFSSVNCTRKELEEILGWADIITLHLSISKKKGLVIGRKELELMKKGAWLINVSRGGVVDEEALQGVLKNGHLSGAALDVFGGEPYEGPLKALENILLTPHVGSYAREARIKMEKEAVENLIKGLEA